MDSSGGGGATAFLGVALLLVVIAIVIVVAIATAKPKDNNTAVYSDNRSGAPPPPPPAKNTINESDLQLFWKGKGILNTSFTLQQVCPGFFGNESTCPTTAAQCQQLRPLMDISDYESVNPVVSDGINGITCFALATSLQNSRLAQIAFGPFPTWETSASTMLSGDTTVGIFLDIVPLMPYIGCMSPMDSGSNGRYGDLSVRTDQALEISSDRLKNDKAKVIADCFDDDKCGLFMAGCGGSQGVKTIGSQKGIGYNFLPNKPFTIPAFQGPDGKKMIPKGYFNLDAWHGTPGTAGFLTGGTDESLEAFEKSLIEAQKIVGPQADPQQRKAGSQCARTVMLNAFAPPALPIPDPKPSASNTCPDYLAYQYMPADAGMQQWNNANGYRESEIDIFVPQDPERAQPDLGRPETYKCVPDPEFVQAFRDAVIGVYATGHCAKDVEATKIGASPCCNRDISEKMAAALAQRYNASPLVKHYIRAWYWDTVDPDGVWAPPTDPSKGRLNITLINPGSA